MESGEEAVAYRGQSATELETSLGKASEGCSIAVGETAEKFISYRGDVTRVEASAWQTRQRAIHVEEEEETVSYGGDIARVEAACWQLC